MPQNRLFQENLHDVLETYRMILYELLETYKIQPREKCEVLEVMGGLRKVCDGWNGVEKLLGSPRTQNQSRDMDGSAQKAWRSFLVKRSNL